MNTSRISSCLVLAALATSARADVWTVDASGAGFTSIQAAIDAAVDGDVIHVLPGTYDGFTITSKSLVITGTPGALPLIASPTLVQSTSVSQPVVLAHLQFGPHFPTSLGGLQLSACAGPVRIQDCPATGSKVLNAPGEPGALIEQCDDVIIARSPLVGGRGSLWNSWAPPPYGTNNAWGGGPGARVTSSSVACFDSPMTAGTPAVSLTVNSFLGHLGGSGLELDGSFAFCSGSEMQGGKGGSHSLTSSQCDWSYGGGPCGNGGHGLWLRQAASTVRVLAPSLKFGYAGSSDCWPWFTDGIPGKRFHREAAGSSASRLPGAPRRLELPSILAGTSTVQLTARGQSGDSVHVVFESQTGFIYSAAVHGVWTLSYPPTPTAPVGVIGASGTLSAPFNFPPLQAGETERTMYVQSYHIDTLGRIFAGTPWSLTLIP